MQLSNYHSHCTFCDGRSFPEDFVKFAIQHQFRAYGFSSHSPLPFETSWNMSKDNMDEYLTEINRLKRKYADQLEIYVSLEIDFLDKTYNPSIDYFQNLPLDYRIGSVHYLPLAYPLLEKNMMCMDGSFTDYENALNIHYEGDIRKLVRHYYQSSAEMVEAGGIDIVGHMDKIYMNGQRCKGFSIDAAWYTKEVLEYMDLIAEKGLMVEINTKNLVKKHETYPHKNFFPALLERKIPVMVNSDCHYPDLVNDGRKEAFELLKAYGFKSTCELVNGVWTEMGIEG